MYAVRYHMLLRVGSTDYIRLRPGDSIWTEGEDLVRSRDGDECVLCSVSDFVWSRVQRTASDHDVLEEIKVEPRIL